jgi:hypothetical protein
MSGSGRHPYEVLNCLDMDSEGKIRIVICNYQFRFLQLFGQVCANKHEIQQKLRIESRAINFFLFIMPPQTIPTLRIEMVMVRKRCAALMQWLMAQIYNIRMPAGIMTFLVLIPYIAYL